MAVSVVVVVVMVVAPVPPAEPHVLTVATPARNDGSESFRNAHRSRSRRCYLGLNHKYPFALAAMIKWGLYHHSISTVRIGISSHHSSTNDM